MSKYLEKAKEIRAIVEPHHNCCQSVLLSFADELGITPEAAFKLGANFGGGMKCGSTCGAVTSALMTLGLLGIDAPAIASKVVREFKERHQGCLNCVELLKIAKDQGIEKKPHCDSLVYECVKAVEENK